MEVIFNQFLLLHGCSDKTNRTYGSTGVLQQTGTGEKVFAVNEPS